MTTENSRADALTELQAEFHRRITPLLTKRQQGRVMGEFRAILAASPVEQPAAAPIDSAVMASEWLHKMRLTGTVDAGTLAAFCDFVRENDAHLAPAPSPADERAAYEIDAEDARAIIDAGYAIPEHWRVKAEHIVSMDRDPAKREEAGKTAVMLLRVLLKDPHARTTSANDTVAEVSHCQCPACRDGVIHASDCAVHNAPAMPKGPCDCGAVPAQADARVGLTDEQRSTLESLARTSTPYEQEVLRSIIATHDRA